MEPYSADDIFRMSATDADTNRVLRSHIDAAKRIADSLVEKAEELRAPERYDVEMMLADGQFGEALGHEVRKLLDVSHRNIAQIQSLGAVVTTVSKRVDELHDEMAIANDLHKQAVADPETQMAIQQQMNTRYVSAVIMHLTDATTIPEIDPFEGPRDPVEISWHPPTYGREGESTPGVRDSELSIPDLPGDIQSPNSGAPVLQSNALAATPVESVAPLRPVVATPVAPVPTSTVPPPVGLVPPPTTVRPVIGSRPTPAPYGSIKAPRPSTTGTVRPVIGSRPGGKAGTPRLPSSPANSGNGRGGGGRPTSPGSRLPGNGANRPQLPNRSQPGGANRPQLPGTNRSQPPGANRSQPGGNRPQLPGSNRSQPGGANQGRSPISAKTPKSVMPKTGSVKSPGVRIARQVTNGGVPQARGTGLGRGRAAPVARSLSPSVIGKSGKATAPGQTSPGVRAPKPSFRTGPVLGRPAAGQRNAKKRDDESRPANDHGDLDEHFNVPSGGAGVIRPTRQSDAIEDSGPIMFGRRRRDTEDDPADW